MLTQIKEGISTGFERVTRNGETLYRVSVETYASNAKEAEAIANLLRREVENFKRPRVESDGAITLELHCYCDDQTHTHFFWLGQGWVCAGCGRISN